MTCLPAGRPIVPGKPSLEIKQVFNFYPLSQSFIYSILKYWILDPLRYYNVITFIINICHFFLIISSFFSLLISASSSRTSQSKSFNTLFGIITPYEFPILIIFLFIFILRPYLIRYNKIITML